MFWSLLLVLIFFIKQTVQTEKINWDKKHAWHEQLVWVIFSTQRREQKQSNSTMKYRHMPKKFWRVKTDQTMNLIPAKNLFHRLCFNFLEMFTILSEIRDKFFEHGEIQIQLHSIRISTWCFLNIKDDTRRFFSK